MGIAGVSTAVLVSASEVAADDKTIFCSEYVPNAQAESNYAKWLTQNPGEKSRWEPFRNAICASGSPTPPAMTTAKGKGLVAAGKMALPDVPPPTTTEPPPTTTVPPPTGCAVSTSHVPDGPDGMGGCFPGPSNTGVPAGTTLTAYTGPCTITVANTVIDSKNVTCDGLNIQTTGVVIRKSVVKHGVSGSSSASFTIEDSLIDGTTNGYACIDCGVDGRNFTVLRTEITNTNRGAYCDSNCLIKDSWVHGTTLNPASGAHASGVRMEQYTTLTHNTLACDYTGPYNVNPETGCSADITGYPDFAPIHHNTIEKNLLIANNGGNGFCAYGGGTSGKPYSGNALNATYIVFHNNVFQGGANGKCGAYGPVTDFISGRTGNVWTGNTFDNGVTVNP